MAIQAEGDLFFLLATRGNIRVSDIIFLACFMQAVGLYF